MKIRQLLYVSAALLMAGCSSDENLSDGTLSGNSKTPLLIEASLSTGNVTTRAAGKVFASGDQLLAYLRHTTGGSLGSYTTTTADQAPKLVTFTKGSTTMTSIDTNTNQAADLTTATPLYWDDFSDSRDANTDLRTSGHGLQSYYGYCYNGGTPSTTLVEETGVLGWTIGNQTTAEAVQHADLLWSKEQTTVPYGHASTQAGEHGTLTIPYTHAMSEVTVTVTCSAGFTGASNPLTSTTLTLNAMNTVTTFTAPTQTFSSSTPTAVQMFGEAYTSGTLTRNFTAIVAPGTKLKVGEKLLDITNVEDNDYTVTITGDMLANDKWATGHTVSTDDGTYILTKPGYNYHLDVTVSKTTIDPRATLQDWTTVNASATGEIQFPDDDIFVMDDSEITNGGSPVNVIDLDENKFTSGSAFTLFWYQAASAEAAAVDNTPNTTYNFATIANFNNVGNNGNPKTYDSWTNTPTIYWPNKTNNYYFRALARYKGKDGSTDVDVLQSVGTYDATYGYQSDDTTPVAVTSGLSEVTGVSQGTVAGGNDILWGTSAKHKGSTNGKTYERGQAIPPRTGDVPIAFDHAMSKVTFQLETTSDAAVTVYNSKVDLTGAAIAVSNLATTGTISVETGAITPAATTAAAIAATPAPISELIVIPQTIGDDAKVTITLADGTTYSLQLNQCVVTSSETAVGAWQRGKHYTYTIHLEKELITFRALIKDWKGVTGSGNANLEWD